MLARFIARAQRALRAPEPDTHAWVAQARLAAYAGQRRA